MAPRSYNLTSLLLYGLRSTKVADCHMGYCIFKTKHIVCKITITAFGCFFIWSKMLLFSAALLLPLRVLSVLEGVPIHSPNFIVKNSSHVTLECSTFFSSGQIYSLQVFIFVSKVITFIKI